MNSPTSAFDVQCSASGVPPQSVPAAPSAGAPIFDSRDRVVVLTPCYGGQITDVYHNALQACLQVTAWFRLADGSVHEMPIIADRISLVSESHIDRGRNTLTNLWVERAEKHNGPRKALWWDADVELPPHHLMRLFLHSATPLTGAVPGIGGLPFVCAPYAAKSIRPSFIVNVRAGQRPDPKTGLVEVNEAGTGCMLWDISVPYKLRTHPSVKPYACAPNSPWPFAKHWAYFTSGVHAEKDRYLPVRPEGVPMEKFNPGEEVNNPATEKLAQWQSEDWMVCLLWRELGGHVYLDTTCKLRHHGMLTYPPDIGEIQGAIESLLHGQHPRIKVDPLRAALAAYTPAPEKAAA